jgi:hypothetical protein
MNTLAFEIIPSPTSNDHEVRIRIDGTDWLGKEHLGIDPPQFFAQQALNSGGKLLVGRCNCGCEGCSDVWVKVVRTGTEVLWTNARGLCLHFSQEDYDQLIGRSSEDHTWEDTKRTAERLVSKLIEGTSLNDGYRFDWASARIRAGIMTLSFSKDGTQKVFEFSWDGQTPQDALAGASRFQKELFDESGEGGFPMRSLT